MLTPWNDTALAQPEERRDLDVPSAVVTGFVRMNREFLISLRGGPGRWVDSQTGKDTRVRSSQLDLTLGVGLASGRGAADEVADLLSAWQKNGTSVHVAAAPGCDMVVAESDTCYIVIPRR